jgi:hypothetical protein
MGAPYESVIASTYQFGINPRSMDGIVCNFALHYFCDTIERLRNILLFTYNMLKPGGVFIFTILDGEAVFAKLAPLNEGETWELKENGSTKYSIKKKYKGAQISAVGQKIAVKLSFTDTAMEEPLCNVTLVIKEAKKIGFVVEKTATMNPGEVSANENLINSLSDIDVEYIQLHRFVVLKTKK